MIEKSSDVFNRDTSEDYAPITYYKANSGCTKIGTENTRAWDYDIANEDEIYTTSNR